MSVVSVTNKRYGKIYQQLPNPIALESEKSSKPLTDALSVINDGVYAT